jgi:hypothetical protein
VWYAGQLVPLRAKEFALLLALLRGSGQVLTRRRLEEALYGFDEALDSNALEVHIHHLRRKLGDDLVKTVRGVGYFVPPSDPAPISPQASSVMHRAAPIRSRPLWRYLWVLTLVALGMSWLTLVFVAYFTGLHEADEITDGQLASSVQMLLRQPDLSGPGPNQVSWPKAYPRHGSLPVTLPNCT